MALKVNGVIEKVLPIQKGQTKDNNEWQKQLFLLRTTEQYNNLYCFEIFGEEKVQNFNKYHKEGKSVEVEFNISTNEWQDKYFTSLSAWKVSTDTTANEYEVKNTMHEPSDEPDDLPF